MTMVLKYVVEEMSLSQIVMLISIFRQSGYRILKSDTHPDIGSGFRHIERFHSDVIICTWPSLITSNVNHISKVSNVLEVDSDAKVC